MFYKTGNSQKIIGWFFFLLFYVQLISPVFANRRTYSRYDYNEKSIRRNSIVADRFEQYSPLDEVPFAKTQVISDSPVLQSLPTPKVTQNMQAEDDGPGPSQPETQSFQSVNTNNMVDLFSGDFTYNIPLLDVGGYPVSLHYTSGITMDQEASWVGLGWNINPGTINRNMRGVPDDFNGSDKITKRTSIKANKTIGVTVGANAELIGKPMKVKGRSETSSDTMGRAGTAGFSIGVFHNNYNGWGVETGINAGINAGRASKGPLSAALSLSNNSQTGLDASPSFSYRLSKEAAKTQGFVTIGTNYNSRIGIQALQMTTQVRAQTNTKYMEKDVEKNLTSSFGGGIPSGISFAVPSFTPTITMPFTSQQYTFTAKIGSEKWVYHKNLNVQGSFSQQYIEDKDRQKDLPAYGYLYYQQAGEQADALLDFNREKDVAFRGTTPSIAIPTYTYDLYSISGEGTGGMFRPYRGDIGMIYDHAMATKSSSGKISLDLGFGSKFHGGIDLNKVWASTNSGAWRENNVMSQYIGFRNQDSLYENVYFKNPGEKVSVDQKFYDKIGDDKLVRVELSPVYSQNSAVVSAVRNLTMFKNAKAIGKVSLDGSAYKSNRDKRTQVISYLTAEEASMIAQDTAIKSYGINQFPKTSCDSNFQVIKRVGDIRKPHHLSEISVLNADGRRYVYGIPAYNIGQEDVSFAVNKKTGVDADGLVNYDMGVDNSYDNNKGKDNFYNQEAIPAYAHSFLLSSIVSPDYVDINNDGITEDDNGDAVKFNYSRIYGGANPYRWRAPFNQGQASYNEGLKTYSRDDRGSYAYGEKEIWYLNSIESKTMISTFVLETDTARHDSYGVLNDNGGRSTTQKLYRLKEINLYSKADYLKNGVAGAKPVKTVHFEYSYELCPGVPSSDNTGKLTLRRVWFTYNKNQKGKLNPYTFNYTSKDPSFNNKSYDRWGNYKDPAGNPGSTGNTLTNGEYPYTLQKGVKDWDSTKAALNIAPWTLNEIKLPSGGLMKVSYESDDYGYVQNRRAMRMFSITGMGPDSSAALRGALYDPGKNPVDYRYIFVRLPDAVYSKAEFKARYLEGVTKLYFKLFVKVPDDKWGTGYEQIPCFADIEDYNIKSGYGNKMAWIRVAALEGKSPMATAAIQFLRLNLPAKAFPFSEPGDNLSFKQAVGMITSAAANFKNAVNSFEYQMRKKGVCYEFDTAKSLVRLNAPDFTKFGGGLRVKKVEIFDNWQKMTTQTESVYGQTYTYKTTALVNNVPTLISSGVSTYEPALGKDENPFFQPIEYAEKMAKAGPTDFTYIEEPLGESLFPSPSVGYSKVAVQTINSTKKSANGVELSEFYTAKDFPTIFENTPLDDESKKTFANPLGNFFKFDAKRYVTLSQGFKVELNDMHGKMKSQSSYAQTNLKDPISYTYNYYKLDNANALNKHLSSKVASIDSANGKINSEAQMGKEVEVLIDVREQTSKTISASIQLNIDLAKIFPPIFFPSFPSLPTFETNRYRSIAVTKVVNRYGILDSVLHIDKGSKISTANMLYDGETGNVLLSRTQNEFDDPVYAFTYPAFWAYNGMGAAYKNTGAIFKNLTILNGLMFYKNQTPLALGRFFESGDEILLRGKIRRKSDPLSCIPENLKTYPDSSARIWAVDMAKTTGGATGIYFIDRDGVPVTAQANYIRIIRSGKRNMLGASVGSITSLKNPIRSVGGIDRLVFDSTGGVVAAAAVQYKDVWAVDSTTYRKDTVLRKYSQVQESIATLSGIDVSGVLATNRFASKKTCSIFDYAFLNNAHDFRSYSYRSDSACNSLTQRYKSSVIFNNFDGIIPYGSVITGATLTLSPPVNAVQIWGGALSNAAVIARPLGLAMRDYVALYGVSADVFNNTNGMRIDETTKIIVSPTAPQHIPTNQYYFNPDVTSLAQGMLDNYYGSGRRNRPSLVIDQQYQNLAGVFRNEMTFGFENCARNKLIPDCKPSMTIRYIPACANGNTPVYSTYPYPGYYCASQPVDTSICVPNINDTTTNPYRWGIWGNWRSDRSYAYYNARKQADPNVATNIRTDGEIAGFMPYWNFESTSVSASQDSSRWVWNSEINYVNSKGLELQNRDALNRFNSAQYGYNQTLPVAVGQNSRYREMMFDGFEDYNYRTDTCKSCPPNRFVNMLGNGALVDSVSHTGIYSLRVAGGQSNDVSVPVVPDSTTNLSMAINSNISIAQTNIPIINGTGTGLNALYQYDTFKLNRIDPAIDFRWGTGNIFSTYRDYVSVKWSGWIQPKFSEYYTFYGSADDRMVVRVNGVRISDSTILESNWCIGIPLRRIFLTAGQLYTISVEFQEEAGVAFANLEWESPSQVRQVVPRSQLYPTNNASGSITNVFIPCIKLNNLQPSKVSLKRFSPIQGTSIIVGAWVREKGNAADTVTSYRNTQLQLVFNNGSTITLLPKGNIIEGWQRIEEQVSVPANATSVQIRLMSTNGSVPVFFDDVRIHPFNSNLKSFVYHPVNIRLMAELDDNNYASFYEYDDDGTLVRVKKETEKGIKTIKETRSALLKEQE
ncbi:MAG: hypothetical protein JWQ27_2331 [Ferruginibacter sp.]|nr:hypothetical protein [Ferruginibacter sp.]